MSANQKVGKISVRYKVTAIVLAMFFIVITGIGVCTVNDTGNVLQEQVEQDGRVLVKQMAEQIAHADISEQIFNIVMEERIRDIAYLIDKQPQITNEVLKDVADKCNIAEINITDSRRYILYSNMRHNIGGYYEDNHAIVSLIETKKDEIMEPIRTSTLEKTLYKYGAVQFSNGKIIQIGIDAESINKAIKNMKKQTVVQNIATDKEILYAGVIDKDLKVSAHSNLDNIGVKRGEDRFKTAAITGMPDAKRVNIGDDTWVYDILMPLYIEGDHVGAVEVGISLDHVEQTKERITREVIITSIIIFLVIGSVLFFMIDRMVKPLTKLADVVKNVANGDLNQRIRIKTNDEIRVVGDSFNMMISSLREMIGGIRQVSSMVMNDTEQLRAAVEQVAEGSQQVGGAIQEVAEGAAIQVSEITQADETIKLVIDGICDINQDVRKVEQSAESTRQTIIDGEGKMKQMTKQIHSITESASESSRMIFELQETSSKIGSIVTVMNGIAEQTNLLALNASIEAARAGEHGRGFAVVAEEIRKLAEQSVSSADDIRALIENTQQNTKKALTCIEQGNEQSRVGEQILQEVISAFDDIVSGFKVTNHSLRQVGERITSTNDQTTHVIKSITEVEEVCQQSAANAEQVAASTQQQIASIEYISGTIQNLEEVTKQLEISIERFKM